MDESSEPNIYPSAANGGHSELKNGGVEAVSDDGSNNFQGNESRPDVHRDATSSEITTVGEYMECINCVDVNNENNE